MPGTLEKIPDFLNEVVTGSSDPVTVALLARLKRDGRVIRLAPRIYTTNLTDSPENVIRRNLWTIVGRRLSGDDFETMRRRLEAADAFKDDDDAILRF